MRIFKFFMLFLFFCNDYKLRGVLGFLRFLDVFCLDFLRISGNGFTPKLWEILWEIPLNFRKCHCYLFCFFEWKSSFGRHRHQGNSRNSLSVLAFSRLFSFSHNPKVAWFKSRLRNQIKSSPNGLFFSFLKFCFRFKNCKTSYTPLKIDKIHAIKFTQTAIRKKSRSQQNIYPFTIFT